MKLNKRDVEVGSTIEWEDVLYEVVSKLSAQMIVSDLSNPSRLVFVFYKEGWTLVDMGEGNADSGA